MRKNKPTIILTLLILLTTFAPGFAKDPDPAEISNTITASCLVKVTCDPAVLELNPETIDYLMRSSAVHGKSARDVLGVSLEEALIKIDFLQDASTETIHGRAPKQGMMPGGMMGGSGGGST